LILPHIGFANPRPVYEFSVRPSAAERCKPFLDQIAAIQAQGFERREGLFLDSGQRPPRLFCSGKGGGTLMVLNYPFAFFVTQNA
jgi:hypothetical protein